MMNRNNMIVTNAMKSYGVSVRELARATGVSASAISQRFSKELTTDKQIEYEKLIKRVSLIK